MIRAGIIGGAGYTAGELIRLLVNHPRAEIGFVHSTSNAGNRVADVHGGLEGDTELRFCDAYDLGEVDVLFLCSAHGESRKWLASHDLPQELRIVDLAQDFRDESEGFVYGLPELQRDRIREARRVANPGCFATAIQLALLPLAAAGLLQDEVHVTAVTGSTGAGVKPSATTHFSWRSDNISVYKAFTHQHLLEIGRNLRLLEPSFDREVNFVPMRGDFTRASWRVSTRRVRSTAKRHRSSTPTSTSPRHSPASRNATWTSSRWSTPTRRCSTQPNTAGNCTSSRSSTTC